MESSATCWRVLYVMLSLSVILYEWEATECEQLSDVVPVK